MVTGYFILNMTGGMFLIQRLVLPLCYAVAVCHILVGPFQGNITRRCPHTFRNPAGGLQAGKANISI